MKKNTISKNWIRKQHSDFYVRESKAKGYRSRSAFKLIEVNTKFNFIKKNTTLLDLGSCPGGWAQVAKKIISDGKILAVDIKQMEKIDRVEFLKGDIEKEETKKRYDEQQDAIIIITETIFDCLFDIEYYGCIIGMFEQNNLGVQNITNCERFNTKTTRDIVI